MLLHSILHLSYKNTKLRFLWKSLLNIFMNINQRFLGVTQNMNCTFPLKDVKFFEIILEIKFLNIFMNIDQRFLGVTQKYELRVSFKGRKVF